MRLCPRFLACIVEGATGSGTVRGKAMAPTDDPGYRSLVTLEPSSADAWRQLLQLWPVGDDDGDESATSLVSLLNRRGEQQVVDWALPLLAGDDPELVSLAAWVMQQHGFEKGRPFGDQVNPVVVAQARREVDDSVRAYLVNALGFSERPELAAELARYAHDQSAEIRRLVAANMPGMFGGEDPDAAAVEVLIVLTRDADPHVRDWATMGLGTQIELDTPAVRDALRARLGDDAGEEEGAATSGEAALGLAKRGDPAVLEVLQGWLDAEPLTVGNLTVEAAGELGNPALLPRLIALRDAGWADNPAEPAPSTLASAIEALQDPGSVSTGSRRVP